MASKRDALVASAEKSLAKGKVDSALKDYQKVLEEIPGDVNILNKVGDLLTRLNRNEEAIPYFTKIAEHFARDGFFLRGIAIYKKINRLDPSRLDVYERLAELYAKQGLTTEAKSQYQVLADYHAKNDNPVAAIGIYQKMAQTDPSNIQLHVKLADLYSQARRKIDALKEYAVVAGLLRERGALDESIQVYEKALQMSPDNAEILRAFVPILLESGRAHDARVALRRALETTPRSVPLFLLSAEAALARERRARRAGMGLEGAVDRVFGRRGPRGRAQGPAGGRHDDAVVRGRGGPRRSGDAPGRGEKGAFDPGSRSRRRIPAVRTCSCASSRSRRRPATHRR